MAVRTVLRDESTFDAGSGLELAEARPCPEYSRLKVCGGLTTDSLLMPSYASLLRNSREECDEERKVRSAQEGQD